MKKKLIFEIETDNYPTWDGTGYTPWDGTGYIVLSLDEAKELVECKDCIYARMTINGDSAKYCLAWQDSIMDSLYLPADFYCGFAERKEE